MLQPITAEFGRGIASAMGNASENVKNIGDIARNYLATEERKKTRAEDVAFRQQQADTAKEQFGKTFGLQQAADTRAQAQEGRHVTEFDRKLLGDQRLAEYNQRLSGLLSRGEMGTVNADKANAALDAAIKSGMTPEQAGAKVFGTYTDAGVQTSKGTADKLLQYSAPKGPRAQAAAIQQAGFESPDYAAEPLLKLQEAKAEPFLKQAAADDLYAQQMNLTKMKIAADEKIAAKNRAAAKEHPIGMYKSDAKGNVVYRTVYNQGDVTNAQKEGWNIGTNLDRAPAAKSSGTFSTVYNSPVMQKLDDEIGSKDAEAARKAASVLQTRYGLKSDEAAALVLSNVTKRTFGDSGFSLRRVQQDLIKAKYPQFSKLPADEQQAILGETATTLNAIYE